MTEPVHGATPDETPSHQSSVQRQTDKLNDALTSLASKLHLQRLGDGNPEIVPDLNALLARREFVKASQVPGAECIPFYEDSYIGTFNTNVAETLPKMIPGYEAPTEEQIQVFEDWKNETPERAQHVYGTMNSKEAALVQSVIRALQPRTMFEFGTHQGILSQRMMEAAPGDAVLFTLDIPPEELPNTFIPQDKTNLDYVRHSSEEMGKHISATYQNRVMRMLGDSARVDLGAFHDSIDLVVVDGGHQYEVAKADINEGWQMLTSGGVMLIDDYKSLRTEGVILAVLELKRDKGAHAYYLNHFQGIESDMVMFVKP